ncbi:MAG: serine hydrolase, partial [Spirochaetaceae bacterium]|nr:serine hydrolase [Spirochaetaceae bacterium]
QGMDAAKLDAAIGAIRSGDTGIHSLLVVRNGYLVSETYFEGRDKDTLAEVYSVTKSVISILTGIAIDRGDIADVSRTLSDEALFGPLRDTDPLKRGIAIHDLLTMTSGLEWSEGDAAYRSFYFSEDPAAYVLGQRMAAEPGEVFNYDSGAVHLLSIAISRGAGMETAQYARKYLFQPLGIKRFEWEQDRQGRSIGGWGLTLTPRDMAKIGYLILRGGEWEGERIVSGDWIETSTKASVVDTGSRDGLLYGYLWWISPELEGFAALGLAGQTIFLVPTLDLVVIITASTPDRGHGAIFRLLKDHIVLAATAAGG